MKRSLRCGDIETLKNVPLYQGKNEVKNISIKYEDFSLKIYSNSKKDLSSTKKCQKKGAKITQSIPIEMLEITKY